jgi:beta-N-acetylhexosaminidase
MSRCRWTTVRSRTILHDDIAPYDWLGMSLASVMPAHVIYPQVDAEAGGFFACLAAGHLARQAGVSTGAIFSDDLSMEAARQGGTLTEAATPPPSHAGCDMVLICNQPDEAEKVLDGVAFTYRRRNRRRRVRRMHSRGNALKWSKLMNQPEYLHAQTLLRNTFA